MLTCFDISGVLLLRAWAVFIGYILVAHVQENVSNVTSIVIAAVNMLNIHRPVQS